MMIPKQIVLTTHAKRANYVSAVRHTIQVFILGPQPIALKRFQNKKPSNITKQPQIYQMQFQALIHTQYTYHFHSNLTSEKSKQD